VISSNRTSEPRCSPTTAQISPQPRVGVALEPAGRKNRPPRRLSACKRFEDALGYRTDQNGPQSVYSLAAFPVSKLPIDPAAAVPAGAKLVPGGVQPDMQTPTLISWSLRVEHQLSPNTASPSVTSAPTLHEIVGVDANEPVPVICPHRRARLFTPP